MYYYCDYGAVRKGRDKSRDRVRPHDTHGVLDRVIGAWRWYDRGSANPRGARGAHDAAVVVMDLFVGWRVLLGCLPPPPFRLA